MLGDMSLAEYYKLMFNLMHFQHWNLNDVESMYPFELDLYVSILLEHLESQDRERKLGQL